jgi:alanyl-tRNA synthetase
VLRRIMRRAIRYGRSIGLTRPFLHDTVQTVFDIMDVAYPELKESAPFILKVVKNEENKFLETLDTGMKLLEATLAELSARGETMISGEVIFRLYDTFGFPVDIVADHVKDTDITLDLNGFETAMAQQKARSKSVKKFTGAGDVYKPLIAEGVKTRFLGYDRLTTASKLLIIVQVNQELSHAREGDAVDLVTAETVFYAESGGQAGDAGVFENNDCTIEITDTSSDPSGLVIHHGTVTRGQCAKGDEFTLTVDAERRRKTEANHTATHILHAALRQVLGDHVKQAGSLVTHDRLRFDFTHFLAVTDQEKQAIENFVNRRIRENHEVSTREMAMEDAVHEGATALFEEKYGDVVRVVAQGEFSKELCGGTHTRRSGDIGLFRIVSEGGIASGVRRIEAATGQAAMDLVHAEQQTLESSAALLKTGRPELLSRLESVLQEKKNLEKELASIKARIASSSVSDIDDSIREINGVRVLSRRVEIDNPSQLRDLADKFKAKLGSGILLLGAESNGKALLIATVSQDLVTRYKAGDIVKQAARVVGGGGGGRPDMAQAGGTQPRFLDQALETVYHTLETP